MHGGLEMVEVPRERTMKFATSDLIEGYRFGIVALRDPSLIRFSPRNDAVMLAAKEEVCFKAVNNQVGDS
jgi:hypothetical protein